MASSKKYIYTMDHVSDDLLIEILIRLPVLSLLRFKTVCKSWHALIGSPDFIHRHATFEDDDDKSNKLGTFIFQYCRSRAKKKGKIWYKFLSEYWNKIEIYTPHFFLLSGDRFEVFKDLGARPLHKQLSRPSVVHIAGSCHGIICLHDIEHRDVYLWNPATKQFRVIPAAGHSGRNVQQDFVAFGFDVKAKDYKLLKITHYFARKDGSDNELAHQAYCHPVVQVYSLNTNSWRYINVDQRTIPYTHYIGWNQGRYMNGKYYLVGSDYGSITKRLVSFDFSQETFRTLEFVKNANPNGSTPMYSTFIGEKVSYVTYHCLLGKIICEVWELINEDECCGKKSPCAWTKRYAIDPMPVCKMLMAISKNGDIGIMGDRHTLKICNLVTREMEDLPCFGGSNLMMVFKPDVYRESLVSVSN